MGKILFYGAHLKTQTEENGTVDIATKIPGVFSGLDCTATPTPDGRYVKKIQIWTENGAAGDAINDIRIEDRDRVLQQFSAQFPEYPVIQRMTDKEVTLPAMGGIAIPTTGMLSIDPIDPIDNRGMQFIPSGLYLCSTFKAGDDAANRVLCINYIWGKFF